MKHFSTSFNSILKSTGLLGMVQVFYILMSVVRNKVAAMILGTWGFGLVDLYNRTIIMVSQSTNMGLNFSAVRRLAELEERGEQRAIEQYIRIVRSWVLLTAIMGILLCIICSPLLSYITLGETHTAKGFLLLSPMVGFLTLTSGELAILKGLHQLRSVAKVNGIGAFICTIITIFFYFLLGVHGIIPVLLVTSFAMLLLNLHATTRLYPYRIGIASRSLLRRGYPMLKLGIAFVMAGIFGSGSEMIVRAYLAQAAGLEIAGIYAAGLTVTVSYAHLILSAMDADYYPRLSACGEDELLRNQLINKQIDVLVFLMAPFLIIFAIFTPIIIRILYTTSFLIAVPMILCALAHMFFKAVYTPIAYLALARGDSLCYMIMEIIYAVIFVGLVTGGYYLFGLIGAGIGLSLANLFDLINIYTVYSRRYGFRFEWQTLKRIAIQFILLFSTIVLLLKSRSFVYIIIAFILLTISITLSWKLLQHETHIIERIKRKFYRKKNNA